MSTDRAAPPPTGAAPVSPKPVSIRLFGWFLLAATLLALGPGLGNLVRLQGLEQDLAGDWRYGELLAAMWICGYNLCFWVAIARRASNLARWLFLALTIVGMVNQMLGWRAYLELDGVSLTVATLAALTQLTALGVLFRADADVWLKRRGKPEPGPQDIFG